MRFHDQSPTGLDGRPAPMSAHAGKVCLVVNVASECGFTKQYAGLQKLHEELAPRGFTVLGFPSNEFGAQEPGTAEEIRGFCDRNYGVTFPMHAKCGTKPGPGQSPVYAVLAAATGVHPSWNFAKYLVGSDGAVLAHFGSRTDPADPELRAAIEKALA